MVSKKRKTNIRADIQLAEKAIGDRFLIAELENRCLKIEKSYQDLRDKLVGLLSKEQVDAAKTCGVTPEVYALEWIDIYCKDKVRFYTPAFGTATGVQSLISMK